MSDQKYEVKCRHCGRQVTDDCISIDRLVQRNVRWERDVEPFRFHTECFLNIAGSEYIPRPPRDIQHRRTTRNW
jgi:hypothetical protein